MILMVSGMFASSSLLHADEFDEQRAQVRALGMLTAAPTMTEVTGHPVEGSLRRIYFDALPWKGNPTKVFAWLGLPENRAGKVPGVVLVHGGGGTAFNGWVARWNAHGFAAISIAVEGQTDERAPLEPGQKRSGWMPHEWAGPPRNGIYQDSDEGLADQWMYHAVADTVLANSLMRSLPEVDENRVGLMGISWGGVIASTVIGLDNRFAFAIPVYGCGHLSGAANQYGDSLRDNEPYRKVWDPVLRLDNATLPTLWLSWPQDKHFPLDCQAASYHAAAGPRMVSLIPNLGHGHGPPWNRPDSYAFAESVVRNGGPWCRQTESVALDGTYRVAFSTDRPLEKAVLVSTIDTGITGERSWIETSADLSRQGDGWQITAELPAGATAWFVNAKSGELTVSSEFSEPPAHGTVD